MSLIALSIYNPFSNKCVGGDWLFITSLIVLKEVFLWDLTKLLIMTCPPNGWHINIIPGRLLSCLFNAKLVFSPQKSGFLIILSHDGPRSIFFFNYRQQTSPTLHLVTWATQVSASLYLMDAVSLSDSDVCRTRGPTPPPSGVLTGDFALITPPVCWREGKWKRGDILRKKNN